MTHSDNILVFQFSAQSEEEFNELVELEETISEVLGNDDSIDGHDFGSGEFNIFILTDKPDILFEKILEVLGKSAWKDLFRSGVRSVDSHLYRPLWPIEMNEFRVK